MEYDAKSRNIYKADLEANLKTKTEFTCIINLEVEMDTSYSKRTKGSPFILSQFQVQGSKVVAGQESKIYHQTV